MNNRVKSIALLGMALSPFVLLISTVSAVKGLSSAPALQMNLKDSAEAWGAHIDSRTLEETNPESVASAIAPLSVSICNAAQGERENGLLSGSKGPGAISATYQSVCVSLEAITDSLMDANLNAVKHKAEIQALRAKLQDIPEQDDVPIFERQRQFSETAAKVRDLLSTEASSALRDTVSTQIDLALSSVVTLQTRDGAFGDRQAEAIENLIAQLDQAAATLHAFLDADSSVLSEKPAPLLSSGRAIAQYWPRLTPQILAAVGVDLAILWVAAFLAVSRGETQRAIRDLLRDEEDEPNAQSERPSKTQEKDQDDG